MLADQEFLLKRLAEFLSVPQLKSVLKSFEKRTDNHFVWVADELSALFNFVTTTGFPRISPAASVMLIYYIKTGGLDSF